MSLNIMQQVCTSCGRIECDRSRLDLDWNICGGCFDTVLCPVCIRYNETDIVYDKNHCTKCIDYQKIINFLIEKYDFKNIPQVLNSMESEDIPTHIDTWHI